jgi:WD40 repeat protein
MHLDGHKVRVNAMAITPDGRTLASADHDGIVRLWYTAQSERQSPK